MAAAVAASPAPLAPTPPGPPPRKHHHHHKLREFHEAHNHLVVHLAEHFISPLSAALFIFGVHKAWQFPILRAYWKGRYYKFRSEFAYGSESNLRQFSTLVQAMNTSRGLQFADLAPAAAAAARVRSTRPPTPTIRPFGNSLNLAAARGAVGGGRRNVWAGVVPTVGVGETRNISSLRDLLPFDIPTPKFVETRFANLEKLFVPEDVENVAGQIYDWLPTWGVEWMLHYLVNEHGLAWWQSIMLVTFTIRFALVPVNIKLLMNSTRMKVAMPEMIRLGNEAEMSDDVHEKAEIYRKMDAVFERAKAHPMVNMLFFPFILPPAVLTIFSAVNNTCLSEPAMQEGGLWWFHDLSAYDPTYVMPVLSCMTWLWLVELSAGVYYHAWVNLKTITRTAAVACIPIVAAGVPNGVLIFWITSNLFAVGRVHVMRSDTIRKALGIPLQSQIAALGHLPRPRITS